MIHEPRGVQVVMRIDILVRLLECVQRAMQ
jgi:hypothetical protein